MSKSAFFWLGDSWVMVTIFCACARGEHRLDGLRVVRDHQQRIVALVDGVLDEPDLLRLVGRGGRLLADVDPEIRRRPS